MNDTKVLVFTDSHFRRNSDGSHSPLRDQFPRFIGALADHFDEVTIASRCEVTSAQPDSGLEPIDENRIHFRELPFYRNTEDYLTRSLWINRKSAPLIRESIEHADVVLLRIHHAMAGVIARMTRKLDRPLIAYWAGPPILATARANYPSNSPRHVLARLVARRKRRVHARIAAIADWNFVIDPDEFEELGRPERAEWIVPNMVENSDIVENPIHRSPDEPLRICFAGRIYRHKGVFDLIDAAVRMASAGEAVRLIFAGQGPDEAELRQTILGSGVDDIVELRGAIPHIKLAELLRSCHVFALPSYGEGLPKVIWEAWASGLALVTTPVGAISQHVDDKRNGILIAAGDKSALTEALILLARDDFERLRIARAGLESVRAHTWSSEISKLASRILQLANGRLSTRLS